MQNKLRLLRADKYAYFICAHMMAEMVVDYLDGLQNAKWLGCEQGSVEGWDDIVQELRDGSLRHTQVKRQATDFSSEAAVRTPKPPKTKKADKTATATAPKVPATSSLPSLGPFDDSISALAKWFSSPLGHDGRLRCFTIQVPDWTVKIKQEFEMRNFEDLCALCRNPLTIVSGLEQRAASDKAMSHMFQWLTTWCGFTDWAHIYSALKHLTIEVRSLERQLEAASEALLQRHFSPASDALRALRYYLDDNVTDTGAATPRQILALLKKYVRPDVAIWTQYAVSETSLVWGVTGFAGGDGANVEQPADTVPIYWKSKSSVTKKLKICAKFEHNSLSRDALIPRLLRLAVHLSGPGHVSVEQVQTWSAAVSGALANTLGVTSNDLSPANLQWVEATDISQCADARHLLRVADVNLEGTDLDAAMGTVVWGLLKAEMKTAITSMVAGDLQNAVDLLWGKVSSALYLDQAALHRLLNGMLSPVSEGLGALGMMRVGPRTVPVLCDGIMMMLVTAVALKRDADITLLLSGGDIRIIASRYWGGPSKADRRTREIIEDDDDAEVEDLLGKEIAEIVLLSKVSSSPSVVNRSSLAADKLTPDSFSAPRRAKLAVTNTRQFKNAVRSGSIQNVVDLLEPGLSLRVEAREDNITKIELTKK